MTTISRLLVGGAGFLVALTVTPHALAAAELKAPGYEKAVLCTACHGFNGNSRSEAVPILAGLPVWYFKKAMEDYAAGRRLSAEMEPFAKAVRQLGVDDVANYFAAQPREPSPVRVDRAAAERGRAASTKCAACHGPEGRGDEAKRIPAITGQPPGYLKNQMLLWKADKRNPGDKALQEMKGLMREFSDDTLGDLAAYYSSLR